MKSERVFANLKIQVRQNLFCSQFKMQFLANFNGKHILIVIIIILFVLAIYWEVGDYKIIKSRKNLSDIKNKDEKARELLFYGCFNAENNIRWREIFIMSIVSSLIVLYIFKQFSNNGTGDTAGKNTMGLNVFLLVFVIIFCIFLGSSMYKTYHLYNGMCGKINPHKIPLHDF